MKDETTIIDVCRSLWHTCCAVVRGMGVLLAGMVRLSYRRWWIVGLVMLLTVGASLWWFRPGHRSYKAEGIVLLNGPSAEQFDEVYKGLMYANNRLPGGSIADLLGLSREDARRLSHFEVFDRIDALADGTPDYTAYGGVKNYTDTLLVRMTDRQVIRFRLCGDESLLRRVEPALLTYFNGREDILASFIRYRATLEREARFCHEQIEKLDSMTSAYYYRQSASAQQQNGIFHGEQEIKLPLKAIEEHIQRTYEVDRRLALATAPVVLESPLYLVGSPLHDMKKAAILALLVGWIAGCIIAWMVENRRRMSEWLKQ